MPNFRHAVAALTTLALGLSACARGPTPDDTIRNLYDWYVDALKQGIDPLERQRNEMKQFVTERLLTSIDTMRQGAVGDPLADAEEFGKDLKLSIADVKTRGGTATARVYLSSRLIGRRTLNVYLVKEEGHWKIDDVKLVEQSV